MSKLRSWRLRLKKVPALAVNVDQALEGQFEWVDGTALINDDFALNEGNIEAEDCVAASLAINTWYDFICDAANAYLCERGP